MPFDDPGRRVEIKVPLCEEIRILDQMAKYLKTPSRWCKETLRQKARNGRIGSRCVVGALRWATDRGEEGLIPAGAPGRFVYYALSAETGEGRSPSAFNDDPSTTHADVLDLIARARKRFE
jgi:hypothetical protein